MKCKNCQRYYERGYTKACQQRTRVYRHVHPGRPLDARKAALHKKFRLTEKQLKKITQPFLDQLERCKDDDARRLLLGVLR